MLLLMGVKNTSTRFQAEWGGREGIICIRERTSHPSNMKTNTQFFIGLLLKWLWVYEHKIFQANFGVKSTIRSNFYVTYYLIDFDVGWMIGTVIYGIPLFLV